VKIDYKIVIIKPEDWEAHIAQVVSVRVSAFEKWNGLKSQEDQEKEARLWFRKWSERHNPALFVAKRDNEIIGYLIADERRRQEYYISHIGVREDLKRKGIGCSLIESESRRISGINNHDLQSLQGDIDSFITGGLLHPRRDMG
jgi:ribosomal protein S18 acetylase RimI-like enzyme